MKKIKKYLVFLLAMILFTGIFGIESHATQLEWYVEPMPVFRLSLIKDKETMIYTAFYALDLEGNVYLLTSAFVGAAMEDGWTATLHTSAGPKSVEHLKTENGVSYLKAIVPGNYYMFKISNDTSIEAGSLIYSRNVDKKIENMDSVKITSYTWVKLSLDFSDWYLENGYYIWDDHYFAENYLKEAKIYGAPLISSSSLELFGTLYMDENYHPVFRDFRRTGLVKDAAIGKVEPDTVEVTVRSNDIGALEEEKVINTDTLLQLEKLEIAELEEGIFTENEEKVAAETGGQMVSENNYLPVVIGGAAVIAAIFYIRKRKQKES